MVFVGGERHWVRGTGGTVVILSAARLLRQATLRFAEYPQGEQHHGDTQQ
jgi:hypothetical protein